MRPDRSADTVDNLSRSGRFLPLAPDVIRRQVGAGMGALGTVNIRRGEFVSKRAKFEGVVADPALDGGVVACCVFGDATGGGGGGRITVSRNPAGGDGGKKRSAGALSNIENGAGPATPEMGASAPAVGTDTTSIPGKHRAVDNNDRNRDALVGTEGRAVSNGSGDRGGYIANTTTNKNNKASNKRNKTAVLASASTCASTGGSLPPAAFLPRGSTPVTLRGGGGGGTATATDAMGPVNDGDYRKSSVFVWPRKLEATSVDAGLEAKVPYRLTCIRATAFEARFKGAHNALLAGTREGLALAFDWGCLLRDSGSGVCGGNGGEDGRESVKARPTGEVLAPSAQVTFCDRDGVVLYDKRRAAVDGRPVKIVSESSFVAFVSSLQAARPGPWMR